MENGKGSGMGKHADAGKGSKGQSAVPSARPASQGGPVPGVPCTQKGYKK